MFENTLLMLWVAYENIRIVDDLYKMKVLIEIKFWDLILNKVDNKIRKIELSLILQNAN